MASKHDILFICTGNCCRSPLAEAILRHLDDDRFCAHSAGAVPAGFIHPLSVATLDDMNIPAEGLESKGWEEFENTSIDAAITLCDFALEAEPPVFPGDGVRVHWPLPDPSFHVGDETERLEACRRIAERLQLKIKCLTRLDFESLSKDELQQELERLADL